MKTVKSVIHDGIVFVMGVMMRHNYRKMSCSVAQLHWSSSSGGGQVTLTCRDACVWKGKSAEWLKDLAQAGIRVA